jgi:hypothetical protein
LELFIPQVKKFSDDGRTWRAGYGPRLRAWQQERFREYPGGWEVDRYEIDQIAKVMGKLRTDQDTRQAVITIWDPAEDWVEGSRDYPCNNWLHFIIRDDKLHLNVGVRSNDLVFGFSHVDFFGWSVLLELMANWVGVGMGTINWNATSMHIYERHFGMMQQIVEETPHPYRTPAFYGVPSLPVFCPWDKFDRMLTHLTTWAQYWAVGYVYGSTTPPGHVLVEDLPWFNEAQKMLWLWAEFKHVQAGHAPVQIYNVLNNMVHSDMRVAALVYLSQRMDGFNWEAVDLSWEEQNYLTLRRLL